MKAGDCQPGLKKEITPVCYLTRDAAYKNVDRFKVGGKKKMCHANNNQKIAWLYQ